MEHSTRKTIKPNGKRKKRKIRRFKKVNRKKLLIVFLMFIMFICVLIGRLIYINLSNNEDYTRVVLEQMNYDSKSIPIKRGDIVYRNGTVLATSEKVYNLILDPYVVLNSHGECEEPTAEAIETYFGIDEKEIYDILDEQPDSRYVVLAKELSYDVVKAYEDFMNSEDEKDQEESQYVKGVWFEEEYLRKYPYDALASTFVGFTNKGNVGTWGIEGYYNDVLNGTNGREYGYLSEESDFEVTTVSPINGYRVVSTIDLNIQRIVEKYINQLLETSEVENIGVIVANPNTGEILAMADAPNYDLNNPRDLSRYFKEEEIEKMSDEETVNQLNRMWRNFCVSDTYEAGSTVKPLTIGAALDENSVSQDQTFMCDGGEELFDGNGMVHIACHNRYGHGTTTLQEAIMWSCNDALMQIGNAIGTKDMIAYQRLFGFGQLTGIDLPGEASASSLVFTEDTMNEFELSTSAFGQGYNLTMVQMVAAFSSVVNGGHYYQPHIVKEITTESGQVVKSFDKVLVRNTLSAETCDWVKEAMYYTVYDEGINTTGNPAQVEGYTVGGKTGTAEKLPRGSGKYVVSFIGFAPVENPEVVVYVVVDELKNNQEDSGTPTRMAGDIIREILPYLQVFPEDGTELNPDIYTWGITEETETEAGEGTTAEGEVEIPEEELSEQDKLQQFLSQWTDEDQDGYDDYTEEYYWDDLAEYMEENGISN